MGSANTPAVIHVLAVLQDSWRGKITGFNAGPVEGVPVIRAIVVMAVINPPASNWKATQGFHTHSSL